MKLLALALMLLIAVSAVAHGPPDSGVRGGGGSLTANAVEESHLKAVDAAADEECFTYESTTGDFEWQACGDPLADGTLAEVKLKAVDAPADEECLTYESTVGDFEWEACTSGGAASTTTAVNTACDTSGDVQGHLDTLCTTKADSADLSDVLIGTGDPNVDGGTGSSCDGVPCVCARAGGDCTYIQRTGTSPDDDYVHWCVTDDSDGTGTVWQPCNLTIQCAYISDSTIATEDFFIPMGGVNAGGSTNIVAMAPPVPITIRYASVAVTAPLTGGVEDCEVDLIADGIGTTVDRVAQFSVGNTNSNRDYTATPCDGPDTITGTVIDAPGENCLDYVNVDVATTDGIVWGVADGAGGTCDGIQSLSVCFAYNLKGDGD